MKNKHMGGRGPRANGQGERLQGERPHVYGETHVRGETHGRTRPQGKRPGRTVKANGSKANGPVLLWGDTFVWGDT